LHSATEITWLINLRYEDHYICTWSYARDRMHVESSCQLWIYGMAFFRSINLSCLPDLADKPNQPNNISFPKRSYGKTTVTNRAFQPKWFDKWRWLHYDRTGDRVFCFLCVTALKTGKMRPDGNIDEAFVTWGYCYWKDASGEKGRFSTHECTSVHKRAVEVVETLPKTTRDIGELCSSSHVRDKLQNRSYVLKIFQTIQFLSRQESSTAWR